MKTVVRLMLEHVGPESRLPQSDGDGYTFEDEIKLTNQYVLYGLTADMVVLQEIRGCQGKVNASFGYKVIDEVCRHIYKRIRNRTRTIENTLDTYLQEDDFAAGFSKLKELLDTGHGTYEVVAATNLVRLSGPENVRLGNVLLRKIDNNYLRTLPKKIETIYDWFSPEKLFDRKKVDTSLEVTIKGYHLGTEQSHVFDEALNHFRRVFSYLLVCGHYLSNLREGRYAMKTTRLQDPASWGPLRPKVEQCYYIRKHGATDLMTAIDTGSSKIVISNSTFVIDSELIEHLERQCSLKNFNEVYHDGAFGQVREKMMRSLDWFLKAQLETDSTDRVIDLFIALESLLSTGGDPLTSQTDDMAENVAMMLATDPDERYEKKREFRDIYDLRSKILHRGELFDWRKDWNKAETLKTYVVWSLIGVIRRIHQICKYAKDSNAIKVYFERQKLHGPESFPHLLKSRLDEVRKGENGKVNTDT